MRPILPFPSPCKGHPRRAKGANARTPAGRRRRRPADSARILHAQGARLALTSRTDRIHDRRAALGAAGIHAAADDLARPGAVTALVAGVEAALGPVGIRIANAGMVQTGRSLPRRRLAKTLDASRRHMIAISLTSAFLSARAVLSGMIACGWRRIVLMSSGAGPLVAIDASGPYAAAKAGLLGLTRVLPLKNGRHGITANRIGPGWIHTASSSATQRRAGRRTPLGRPGTPEEIGHVAAFLASEEASYLTGQMIVVDGDNMIQEIKGGRQGRDSLRFKARRYRSASCPRSARSRSASGRSPGRAAAPMRSLTRPAVIKNLGGRPRASATA